jgi:hypothetical protein
VSALTRLAYVVLALASALIAGCASTPEAPPVRDAQAKEFLTHPSASTIYVYRSPFNHLDADTVLYVDGRLIGATRPGTYFRLDVNPGRHVLHGNGIDLGEFQLDTRPGQVYFVSHAVNGGHSQYRLVPERVGQQDVVACCALLENWWPGQRPFIR